MRILLSISTQRSYYYGMRVRPFSIGTQPKGHTEFIDHESAPREIREQFSEPDYRFGILVYPHPLSELDIDHYSLTDLNVASPAELWKKFRVFCQQMHEYGVKTEEFIADYIHPRGELRSENPLHALKPEQFFALLQKNGYPGRLEGFRKFYNSLGK